MAARETLKLATVLFKAMTTGKGFDRVLDGIVLTSVGNGNCTAEFTVTEDLLNRGGTLHGGCSATIVDALSTVGLLSAINVPGVSVNINMNYLRAANEGDRIMVDSSAVKIGKTLAYLQVSLKKKKTGELIATGTHTKFVGR